MLAGAASEGRASAATDAFLLLLLPVSLGTVSTLAITVLKAAAEPLVICLPRDPAQGLCKLGTRPADALLASDVGPAKVLMPDLRCLHGRICWAEGRSR